MIEPGKFLVATAGFFLVEVTAIKRLQNKSFIYTSSGFNHLIRPMYYGSRHNIENISSQDGFKGYYQVVGYLCETDTFANSVHLSETNPGDILMIHNAGAYGFSMSSNYNSRVRPAEVAFRGTRYELIRRREVLQDIMATEMISSGAPAL